jgi:ADP-dependent NAD(P)H-hydrate dehydratase / NAD(P)H-hydrate epimerase
MALLLTAAQMRAVDRAVIDSLGLPGLVLMENAGRGVFEIIAREHPRLVGLEVRVVCGAGQNGGDGFVIARHLLGRGARVKVLLAMPADKITGDALVFLKVLRALSGEAVVDLSFEAHVEEWRRHLSGAAVVVDALFGTGLRADVAGVPAAAISGMNATEARRVAVDIPSGLDADSGQVRGVAVEAHVTATMGARKLGLVVDADAPVGRIEVVDLGVASERALDAALAVGPLCHWLDEAGIAQALPRRTPTGHKGTAGHLLAIAGSVGKTGAGLLAARAALRAGAGMVTIATTAAAQAAFDAKVVAEMTTCYAQGEDADANSFADLAAQAAKMKAVVVGPGIPTGEGMAALVRRLVAELPLPLVVDADALNLLGGEVAEVARKATSARVLTPHPGEMARLRGCSTADIARDRLGVARRLAADSGAVVVLKGARTIVAVPDGTAYLNPTANSALGTAGSGDVLAGTIGAFLAQGMGAKDAACAGVFVHGAAAEIAVRAVGSRHLIATDLPDAVARACEALRSV